LYISSRAAPILPVKFLEKYDGKSKEQNATKMGEILDVEGLSLSVSHMEKIERTATNSIMLLGKVLKDQDTLIEQSRCYKIL